MSKRTPSTSQLLVVAGFAFSCFGLLLFLWITFGGPTPFKAKPYEVLIPFDEATQLAQQSDVRISGVTVGKVQTIDVTPDGQRALATVHIENKYGPIPQGTRAILRTKTLLGETYVELTPGSNSSPDIEDGGKLPFADVADSVQLDEIFRTFDPPTQAAFREWMRNSAVAINENGDALSTSFGELGYTFEEFDRVARVLDSNEAAVSQLFSNSAVSLNALRGRNGQLAQLIENSNAVFQTAAAREADIEALFKAFPTFLDEFNITLDRLRTFSEDTEPLMRQLVPAAEELSPTLIALSRFAPEAEGLFKGLIPVINRAPSGFPALRKLLRNDFPPLLRAVDPFARNFNPILTGLGLYKREVTGFMANVAAATNSVALGSTGEQYNYLKAMGPLNPESVSTYPNRLAINRNSAYSEPGVATKLATGLPSFDTRQCSAGVTAALDPTTPENPVFLERLALNEKDDPAKRANLLYERIKHYAFAGQDSTASIGAPGCTQQAPFKPIFGSGPETTYQHTFEQP